MSEATRPERLLKAREEGRVAAREGKGVETCLYRAGTECADHWLDGWRIETLEMESLGSVARGSRGGLSR